MGIKWYKKIIILALICSYTILYAETPTIFWASDPVKPNQTIAAQGHLLDAFNFRGGKIIVEPYRPSGYLNGFQTIGVIMRENRLENLASLMVCGPVQNVLIENNYIANTEAGVIVNSEGMGAFECNWCWPEDVLIRDNDMKNVNVTVQADEEANAIVIE